MRAEPWMNKTPKQFRQEEPPAPYRLMLRARLKALVHTRFCFPRKGCRIWRMYSHFGFKTRLVFCQCGKEFH